MEIFVSLTFDAAHLLPNVPSGHKCGNLHGHTFQVEIYVNGEVQSNTGWVIDFTDIKKIASPVIATLDHSYLNDIPGLENPTSENIAIWVWSKLHAELRGLTKIIVRETPSSGAIYEGEV